MSIAIDWASQRASEDEHFERVFAEHHGAEMRDYYGGDRSGIGLSCFALEAAAPETGVYSNEIGTIVHPLAARVARAMVARRLRRAV